MNSNILAEHYMQCVLELVDDKYMIDIQNHSEEVETLIHKHFEMRLDYSVSARRVVQKFASVSDRVKQSALDATEALYGGGK